MWLRHSNQPQSVKESVGIRGGKKNICGLASQGGTVAIHFVNHTPIRRYISFSLPSR